MPKRKASQGLDVTATDDTQVEATSTTPRKRARNVAVSTDAPKTEEATPARKRAPKVKVEAPDAIESPSKTQTNGGSKVTPKRSRKPKSEVVEEENGKEVTATTTKVANKAAKSAREIESAVKEEIGTADTKVKKKRKTKEEKEAEAMPLAPRTAAHKLFVGAHVSASGGVHNAITNSTRIGGNAFALFLKSQRKWANPALAEDVAKSFHSACAEHKYDAASHVVPHGSYLVNLAHTDPERTTQAYDSFLDDLQRCERLGIKLYNFHPGNTTGGDRATAIKHLASNLNRAHKATKSVITLLENMAAAGGNIIGTTFEDLRDIISHVEDKNRVGICLDTCHAFAAGYDLRTPEAYEKTFSKLDEIVGLKYLRALHLNDSKAPFESRRDLHANIGTGFLGLRAFHNIANDSRLFGLPLVLETPIGVTDDDGEPLKDEKNKDKEDAQIWATEIKLIESLTGMDTTSAEFLDLEKSLARKGAKERARLADQAERRVAKDAKKAAKGKKNIKAASDDSELSETEE